MNGNQQSSIVLLKPYECIVVKGLIDSMWRTLSYSARLDEPAAGKVLVTAFWGCLGDQGSGTNNYKGPRRGKGIETWPSAFSKYCFKKKTKFLVRHLGRLPEEQKQAAADSYKWEPTFTKSPPIRGKVARRRQSKKAPELHHVIPKVSKDEGIRRSQKAEE